MNKRNTQNTQLRPELVETYRTYPPVVIAGSIRALTSFLSHRALFEAVGDAPMAAAAERAWWQDAVILAGEPASSAHEAREKVRALQPALDGRVWQTGGEGHRAFAAMITVAVEAERRRWDLATPTRH